MICDADLVYLPVSEKMQCVLCKQIKEANACCSNRHFVCDSCHQMDAMEVIEQYCLEVPSTNPLLMANRLMNFPHIHMHGPEHHFLVPAVLISAWYTIKGVPEQIATKLKIARKRAETVPGGACGFHGTCGAAVGAGIFLSIVLESNPLATKSWQLANRLTATCLLEVADLGGPRCCKRDTFVSLQKTIDFCKNEFNVHFDSQTVHCAFHKQNQECLMENCPFYPKMYSIPDLTHTL